MAETNKMTQAKAIDFVITTYGEALPADVKGKIEEIGKAIVSGDSEDEAIHKAFNKFTDIYEQEQEEINNLFNDDNLWTM